MNENHERRSPLAPGVLPIALTIRPISTLRQQLAERSISWRGSLQYFGMCLLVYIVVRLLTGYDPLDNTIAISGEAPSTTPGIRSIKRAGYFLVRHYWSFLFFYALVMGMVYRVFFGGRPLDQRLWIKVCLYVSGQLLLFVTLIIPLSYLSPYFYFLPFILEALYVLPVLALMGGGKPGWALVRSAFALMIGHGLYALLLLGCAFAVIDILGV